MGTRGDVDTNRIFKIVLYRMFDDSSAIIAGRTTMVDETKPSAKRPCRWRKSKDDGRRHKTIGGEIKTFAET
jgi:hypothetical protein